MKTNFSKYPELNSPGIINHAFVNASEKPGQYEAEQCNRQAVTAEWLFEHPDVQGYLFSEDNASLGLDPWRLINGMDADVHGAGLYVEWGRTSSMAVDRSFAVYVSRKDAAIAAQMDMPKTPAGLDDDHAMIAS